MRFVAPFAIACLLSSSAAFAQSTPPAPPASSSVQASGKLQFYNRTRDEVRASKLIGTSVTNNANETVGDINDLILNRDGQVAAVVIGVGGFLGMGERDVAVNYNSLRIEYDASAMTESGATKIRLDATKDQLKAAPAWTWTGGTTGQGTTTKQ
jgi:sporulation protein YlmC with PRC-barrel domain